MSPQESKLPRDIQSPFDPPTPPAKSLPATKEPLRVLMVGSGPCQVNGIKALQQRGIYVIAADYNAWTPGKALANQAVIADAFDAQAITAAAREMKVHGIMTMGTDQPVYAVNAACAALGLPHDLSLETARMVTHKKFMKQRLQEQGIRVVPWHLVSRGACPKQVLQDLPGPYVLKPVDSQGQRGIFRVKDASEVQAHLEATLAYSREDYALVESYYPSKEITVSGWVQEGALEILTVTDRLCFDPELHLGVCTGHRYPSRYARGAEETVEQISRSVCQALGIQQGPFYLQLLRGEDGILVNEVACRLGGAYEDITIPLVTGTGILDAVIDSCLGIKPLPKKAPKGGAQALAKAPDAVRAGSQGTHEPTKKTLASQDKDASALHHAFFTLLFFCKSGQVAEAISLEEFKALPFIVEADWSFEKGTVFEPIESAAQRAGWLIVAGKDEEEVAAHLQQAKQALKILDPQGKSLLMVVEG